MQTPPHHLPPCGHVPFNNMFFMCSLSYNRETCPNIFNTWYSTVSTPLAPLTRSVSDQALPSISSCPCCPASELRELMRELLLLLVLCWVLLQNILFKGERLKSMEKFNIKATFCIVTPPPHILFSPSKKDCAQL